MRIYCNRCIEPYVFSEKWFKKNDPQTFICRKCKIKETTRSAEFRSKASLKSKNKLSDPNIKARMSQLASLNNIKNAEKISESLKKYYKLPDNRKKVSIKSLNNWKNPKYVQSVSDGLSKKWEDPTYRGKVLGSREHVKPQKLSKQLHWLKLEHEANFILAAYVFDALIMGKYLYDEQPSNEKRLFVEHYYKEYIYINDLNEIQL